MRILRGKTILIISSEIWSEMFVSKHHYAISLAKNGNSVFFLNPMESILRPGAVIMEHTEIEDLAVIRYSPLLPEIFKFKWPGIFQYGLLLISRKIKRLIGRPIDIVWDFNTYSVFRSLNIFGAKLKVLHPVDSSEVNRIEARDANISFSVSKTILEMIDSKIIRKEVINHGVSDQYLVSLGERRSRVTGARLTICYVGNLLIHSLDRDIVLDLVRRKKNIDFHFIGPYDDKGRFRVGGETPEVLNFINELKSRDNVFLHGRKSNLEVARLIRTFDIYLVCYRKTPKFNEDNSHKILEYLAAGNVILSSYISFYDGTNLLKMARSEGNSELVGLLEEVERDIELYNSEIECQRRIEFALGNTYQKQLEKIDDILFEMNGGKDS
jgi:hypothetical protein